MYVCDHRYHHLWTLEGPTQVVNRLVRCPEPSCASRGRTFSPEAAWSISMPRWCLGIFAYLPEKVYTSDYRVVVPKAAGILR
jgi:disulfide bond formation protein DsbB